MRGLCFIADDPAVNCEFNQPFIDVAVRAFRAGHGNVSAALQDLRGVSGADDAGKSQFAADDGAVAGAATAIRDDGRRPFHDWFPGRIGH